MRVYEKNMTSRGWKMVQMLTVGKIVVKSETKGEVVQ